MNLGGNFFLNIYIFLNNLILYMLNKIYIHYITTLFVLESFILSCWLLKGKKNRNRPVCLQKIGIGIGQFACKESVSESESESESES